MLATAIYAKVETIYREQAATIFRFCLWRTNSRQDAEDAATEVFVKVLQGKADGVAPERLIGWLIKTADNECKMLYRRRRRRREVDLKHGLEIAHLDSRPWVSPDICRAINQMRPIAKRVFFLKAVEGMLFKEIAAALNISEGAAKMTFYRAVKRLAKVLVERNEF